MSKSNKFSSEVRERTDWVRVFPNALVAKYRENAAQCQKIHHWARDIVRFAPQITKIGVFPQQKPASCPISLCYAVLQPTEYGKVCQAK